MANKAFQSWKERFLDLLTREPKTRSQLTKLLRDAAKHNLISAEMLGMVEHFTSV